MTWRFVVAMVGLATCMGVLASGGAAATAAELGGAAEGCEPGSALGCCIGEEGSLYETVVCDSCDITWHIVFGQHCLH